MLNCVYLNREKADKNAYAPDPFSFSRNNFDCIFPAFNIISKTIAKLEAEKKSPPFSTTSPAIENAKLVPKSTALPISKCQILTNSKIL